MRTRIPAFILAIVPFVIAACNGNKDTFVLHGTVQDGGNDSILVVGIDSRFERTDTIFLNKGQFKWTFRPDTVTALLLILPDGRRQPVFAEKGVSATLEIPAGNEKVRLSGGYCNDIYQSYYLASLNDTCVEQASARIDSVITRDPFNEVTPYLIYEQMVQKYHADEKDIQRLISRMSGNMQDAPYLVALKAEFLGTENSTAPLSSYAFFDSTGTRHLFANIGDLSDKLLVCVWNSWEGQKGFDARKQMEKLKSKYLDRRLSIIDLSIDVNRDRWKEAIKKDSLSWTSYIDQHGWHSRIVRTAKIQDTPCFVLFNEGRRVEYKTGNIDELDRKLNDVLSRKDLNKEKNGNKPIKLRTVFE